MGNIAKDSFLFDMDGVLFDSMPLHEKSWKATFKCIGLDYPTEMIYMNEGRPGTETIVDVYKKLLNEVPKKETINKLYKIKSELMAGYGAVSVIKGMEKVVNHLTNKGFKLCVVTGSSQETLLNDINKNYNNAFGCNVVTGKDVMRGKPDPEPYIQALKLIDSTPEKSIVIENAPLGIESAKTAGIFTIAINSGKLNTLILKESGADVVVENAGKLLFWLKQNL